VREVAEGANDRDRLFLREACENCLQLALGLGILISSVSENQGQAVMLAIMTLLLGVVDSWAMLLPSSEVSGRQTDMGQIQAQLETKVVQERLGALGLTSQEVQARVQNLSDDQIHELAQNLDGIQMGGDALVAILIIVGAVVLVLFLISAVTGTAHDVGHAAGGGH
jgi:hypothetical protein